MNTDSLVPGTLVYTQWVCGGCTRLDWWTQNPNDAGCVCSQCGGVRWECVYLPHCTGCNTPYMQGTYECSRCGGKECVYRQPTRTYARSTLHTRGVPVPVWDREPDASLSWEGAGASQYRTQQAHSVGYYDPARNPLNRDQRERTPTGTGTTHPLDAGKPDPAYPASPTLPLVLAFALQLEQKLQRRSYKGGPDAWRTEVSADWLLKRLREEVEELAEHFIDGSSVDQRAIADECADVANLALMISDLFGQLGDENAIRITHSSAGEILPRGGEQLRVAIQNAKKERQRSRK